MTSSDKRTDEAKARKLGQDVGGHCPDHVPPERIGVGSERSSLSETRGGAESRRTLPAVELLARRTEAGMKSDLITSSAGQAGVAPSPRGLVVVLLVILAALVISARPNRDDDMLEMVVYG